MDAPVKERLTGALILIALLVIVVPEMLSGPDDRTRPAAQSAEAGPPLRTYSLQLDTAAVRSQDQSALSPKSAVETPVQAAPTVDASAAAAPEAPVAAAEQKPVAAESKPPAMEQKPVAAAVSPPKPPVPSVSPAARTASAGQWWAQLGSFASHDNAERLTRELREAGYSVNLARVQTAGKDLYRVRAGPASSREAALSLQTKLAAAGHKSSLVAP